MSKDIKSLTNLHERAMELGQLALEVHVRKFYYGHLPRKHIFFRDTKFSWVYRDIELTKVEVAGGKTERQVLTTGRISLGGKQFAVQLMTRFTEDKCLPRGVDLTFGDEFSSEARHLCFYTCGIELPILQPTSASWLS